MIPCTMILDQPSWDLHLAPSGNLEATSIMGEYVAQTVANEWRLFRNDAFFFKNEGFPYFETTIGMRPSEALVTAYLMDIAYGVYGVANVSIERFMFEKRLMSAEGHIRTTDGEEIDIVF